MSTLKTMRYIVCRKVDTVLGDYAIARGSRTNLAPVRNLNL